MDHRLFHLLLTVFIFILTSNIAHSLSVSIKPVKTKFTDGKKVELLLTYKNNDSKQYCIKNWFAPKKELEHRLFSISCLKKDVPYIGKMVKRGAPTVADTVIVKPGEKVETKINLASGYDLSKSCRYLITFPLDYDEILLTGVDGCESVMSKSNTKKKTASTLVWVKAPVQSTI